MFSVIAKYQLDIKDELSDNDLLEYLIEIDDEWFLNIFKKYSDTYKKRTDHVTVVSELTNLINFLEKQISESEKLQLQYLQKIVDLNFKKYESEDKEKFQKILKGLISFKAIYSTDPNPEIIFNAYSSSEISVNSMPIQLFKFIELFLFANAYRRQVSGIPNKFDKIHIPFPMDLQIIMEQRERVNHQLNMDILTNIVLRYFENSDSFLPISFDELEARINAKKFHGNKKTEYDDEIIKSELEILLKKERFIHKGKNYGKANVRALSIQLLNTKFKDVKTDISLRQMSRKVKSLLPEHLKI